MLAALSLTQRCCKDYSATVVLKFVKTRTYFGACGGLDRGLHSLNAFLVVSAILCIMDGFGYYWLLCCYQLITLVRAYDCCLRKNIGDLKRRRIEQ